MKNDETPIVVQLSHAIHDAYNVKLDDGILHATERALLDTCACAFGARDSQPVLAARGWAGMIQGTPSARILGTSETSSVLGAAIANSTMGRQLDMNDAFWGREVVSHPSDNIGGCLAVADAIGASSEDLLRSILIAYEVHMRATEFSRESWYMKGGWDVAFFLPLASAAAAGSLLRLDPTRLAHAMAIAASNAILGEIRVGHISTMKALASGRAVAHGVEAAYLAYHGVTGPLLIFEGARGLSKLILGACDWDMLTGPITTWRLPETCYKQYPAAYIIHSAIDATLALRHEHGLTPDRIKEVVVSAYGWLIEEMVDGGGGKSRYDIDVRETADHSLPYCVAVSLVDGEYTTNQLDVPRWTSPEVREMLAKVKCIHDPALDGGFPANRPANVKIVTHDGKTFERLVSFPKGDPRNPLSDDDIAGKFRQLSKNILTEAQQQKIIATTLNLHKLTPNDFFEACTEVAP